jgi:hypothetical protein
MIEVEYANRMERAVNSCRESAMATGGAQWVAAVDETVAAIRAAAAIRGIDAGGEGE